MYLPFLCINVANPKAITIRPTMANTIHAVIIHLFSLGDSELLFACSSSLIKKEKGISMEYEVIVPNL